MAWRLARSLVQLQRELDARFPGRTRPDWTIGDAAHRASASDHNPNAAGVVCAIDVRGRDVAAWLWDHLSQRKDPRMKYAIFRGRIMSSTVSPWTARTYTGSNPHNDHIHISVGRGPDGRSTGNYDDTSPWGISTSTSVEDALIGLKKGDEGEPVKAVQELVRLAGRGAALGTAGVDGIYGNGTAEGVRLCRKDVGSRAKAGYGDRITGHALAQLIAAVAKHQAKKAK